MVCKHYKTAVFWTHNGPCDECVKERIQQLEEENKRLRRDLQDAQIELGRRQEIE